jgi:hypothetical protein
MSATITVREVLRQCSALLQDTDPQFARQPESEMVDWLNECQLFIASVLPMSNSVVGTLKLRLGSAQSIASIQTNEFIPLDGTVLTNQLYGLQLLRLTSNMGTDGFTQGQSIRLVQSEAKNAQNPSWRTKKGSAVKEYTFDPVTPKDFEVWPAVIGNVWVRAAFCATPKPVPNNGTRGAEAYASSGSNPTLVSLSDDYIPTIIDWIVARSHMRDNEWSEGNKSSAFTERILAFLNARMASVAGSSANLKTLPFSPQPVAQAA